MKPVTIVTGATGAIGKAIARQMAENGYEVIMICRNAQKAEAARKEIIQTTKNQNVFVEIADLSRLSGIKSLAARMQAPVFSLINNAAATPMSREETADGIEMQFAANVLNYFWMSLAFRPHLKKTASDNRSARIVNVASFWAGDLDLNDLEFKKRRYSNNTAYRQSRQANRMLTAAFAEKFKGDGITVNSCHPGEVNSALSNSMGFGGRHSPDQGAQTPVWLATSDDVENITGKWFSSFKSEPCPFSRDKAAIEELYGICEKYSKEIL